MRSLRMTKRQANRKRCWCTNIWPKDMYFLRFKWHSSSSYLEEKGQCYKILWLHSLLVSRIRTRQAIKKIVLVHQHLTKRYFFLQLKWQSGSSYLDEKGQCFKILYTRSLLVSHIRTRQAIRKMVLVLQHLTRRHLFLWFKWHSSSSYLEERGQCYKILCMRSLCMTKRQANRKRCWCTNIWPEDTCFCGLNHIVAQVI